MAAEASTAFNADVATPPALNLGDIRTDEEEASSSLFLFVFQRLLPNQAHRHTRVHALPGSAVQRDARKSISGSPELRIPERTTDGSRQKLRAKDKAKATHTTPRREERPHRYTKFQTRAALHHRARNGTGLYR